MRNVLLFSGPLLLVLAGCAPTTNQINDMAERQIQMEAKIEQLAHLEADLSNMRRDIERIEKNQLLLAQEIQAVRKKNINLKTKSGAVAKSKDKPDPTGKPSPTDKPHSDADGIYSKAESTYYQGEYEEAILQYQKFIDIYPRDQRVPTAYLRQGLSLINLGRNKEARFFLNTLVDKYPKSNAAKVAREKLKTI